MKSLAVGIAFGLAILLVLLGLAPELPATVLLAMGAVVLLAVGIYCGITELIENGIFFAAGVGLVSQLFFLVRMSSIKGLDEPLLAFVIPFLLVAAPIFIVLGITGFIEDRRDRSNFIRH